MLAFVQITGDDDCLNLEKSQVDKELNETAQIEPFASKNNEAYAVGLNQDGEIIFKDTKKAFKAFKYDNRKRLWEIGLSNGLIYLSEKNWRSYKKPAFLTGSTPARVEEAAAVRAFFTYYSNSF